MEISRYYFISLFSLSLSLSPLLFSTKTYLTNICLRLGGTSVSTDDFDFILVTEDIQLGVP